MATTKFQVTKIQGVPGIGGNPVTADHVYFSIENEVGSPPDFPSWNDGMYTQYVTDQGGQPDVLVLKPR